MIASIQIALTQPISLDDYIVVDNVQGWVEEIGWQFVVVRCRNHKRVIFPLSRFVSGGGNGHVENWTKTDQDAIVQVDLGIVEAKRAIINELSSRLAKVAADSGLWDGKICRIYVCGSASGNEISPNVVSQVKIQAWVSCINAGMSMDALTDYILENFLISA